MLTLNYTSQATGHGDDFRSFHASQPWQQDINAIRLRKSGCRAQAVYNSAALRPPGKHHSAVTDLMQTGRDTGLDGVSSDLGPAIRRDRQCLHGHYRKARMTSATCRGLRVVRSLIWCRQENPFDTTQASAGTRAKRGNSFRAATWREKPACSTS